MITRVQVKNYRSLADVDVELGPLTVLVGRNGAGKSTFLDVLRFVRDALQFNLDAAIQQRGGIISFRRWQPKKMPSDIMVALKVKTPDLWGDYSFKLDSAGGGEYRVSREYYSASVSQIHAPSGQSDVEMYETIHGRWHISPQGMFPALGTANGREQVQIEPTVLVISALSAISPVMSQFRQRISNTRFYNISPALLRNPQPQRSIGEQGLEDWGFNLAVVLTQIERLGRKADLLSSLRHVVDGVIDYRVRQTGSYSVIELQHKMRADAAWFDLAQESDGTIRVLALLAALYQDVSYSLIAIEEPELAVHPGALAVLSDVIREASQRTQIIITTQSPDLISRFSADELRVVERIDGQTRIGPVDERQRKVINEQLFSAGDLLRIEGLHINTAHHEAAEVAA